MDPIFGFGAIALLLLVLLLVAFRHRGTDRGRRPYLVLGGFGTAAVNMAIDGVRAMRDLGIVSHILVVPAIDLNEATYQRILARLLPKEKIIFPSRSERRLWGLRNDRQLVRESREHLNRIITRVNDTIVGRLHKLDLKEALTITPIGWQGGHRWPSMQALRERRRMMPGEIILPIIIIPDQPERRNEVRDNPRLPVELVGEGIAPTTIIVDNMSQMVQSQQEEAEISEREVRGRGIAAGDRRLMVGLASITAGQYHFRAQLSAADAIRNMASYGRLTGISFGCRHLPNVEESLLAKLWREFWHKRPKWLITDVELAVRLAVEDALNIHAGNSTVDAIPLDWPAGRVLAITVPIYLGDRGWGELRARINNWLKDEYPYLTVTWTSGHGAPEFGAENYPYHVQASCWWALNEQEIPDPIQKLMNSQDMRVRRTPALVEGEAV